jgi:sulfur-carrier protein adenylyltransferase/sulfurtransferase
MEKPVLGNREIRRFHRHIILPEVGIKGQRMIKNARVLVVGAGGLGAPVLQYLTAAGVGTIGIMDDDKVEEINLQRQVLYGGRDLGKHKAIIAKTRLERMSHLTSFNVINIRLTPENADEFIPDYDFIVDASDNLDTHFLINDNCLKHSKVMVYAAAAGFKGMVSIFNYRGGPSFRCAYEARLTFHDEAPLDKGMLGVLSGITGAIEACELIKSVLGREDVLSGQALNIDILKMEFKKIQIPRIEKNFPS